ncbi:MAG TPA: FAD-binding oxidoreductase, partial [Azonexus sp.]
MTSTPSLSERLAGIVGAAHVLTAAADLAPYLTDWRGRYRGAARCLVRPGNAAEVAAVVRACADAAVPVVPQGGNTSLCGAATPDDAGRAVVISLGRLTRIVAVDPQNNTISVEAGCTLAAVQEAARAADRLFPLALASEGPCQIGGTLSTNAGGVQVLRYGNTRDLTLGLEVVLPNGDIWNGLRGLRKDNTGYDLKQLFIGAEGTLGIITAAVLKLFPRPKSVATACIAVRDPAAAVELLAHLRANCGDTISGYEFISRSCLDLVFKHIADTHEPFAGKHEWIVITQLADVLQAPLDAALRYALNTFGSGIIEF